uniref:NPHS1 adhesion molecule, nephrin n=1 Tax=Poecilia mexicana TaxID=48701 RepID=A0A3B3XTE2_9TELE
TCLTPCLPLLFMSPGTHAQQAFRTEPRNLTVRMGATAVLKCEVLRASGIVQWAKDGFLLGPQRSLPGFPRYSMIGRRGQYYLRIEDAQLDDDAFFECQAGQSERSDAIVSNPAFLTVQIPPSKPYFTTDVTTPWVAGKKYMVECVAPDAKPSKRRVAALLKRFYFSELLLFLSLPLLTDPPEPPYIIGLDRDVVKAGSLLVLECVSHGGNPLGTLQWTKEGEVLSTTWGEEVVGQKSRNILRLQITPADNQAELSCESANIVSPSPLSVTRKITVFFGPATLTQSGSLEAIEGQELTLSCHASSSNPPVHIRWWLGHKELSNTSVTMEEVGLDGTQIHKESLFLTELVVRKSNGIKKKRHTFKFVKSWDSKCLMCYPLRTDPPQKVFIDSPPEDIPLRSGSRAVLVCHSAGGNPPAKLTWFKVTSTYIFISSLMFQNGKKVSDAEPQTSSNMVVTRVLNLLLTASDNQAAYRCDATNEAKRTISAHAKLLVQFTAVTMKITAKEEVFYRGQQMELECLSGSSNPKSDISWKVGPLRLQGVEEAPKEAEFGGVSVLSRLHLNLTSQHHNQKVICQAYSPVLEEGASTFYQLNVIYPPEFSSEQATEVQVVEDDVATIPLMVSANPEVVSCIWLRRKQMLVKGDPGLYDHSLEIRNVTRKDKGLYTIKCENGEGVNETTVKLDVYYAPTVKAEKDPVYVNQGGTADLICVADANPIIPEMFSWKWLGEEEVEMGEETNENKSSLLTIHNVTRAHAGFYQCSASNGIALPGSVEMRLVVQFIPELRKGPQWRKVASRGDGTATAELVCQAEGIPPVEFTWEKKGMLIDLANPRYEERTARDGSFHTSTLRVVNVSATLDYAVFSCTARNSLGEDKLDIQLVSTNHPDPPSSFSLVGVTHNSVTLEWIPGFNGGLQQRYRIRYIWDQSVSYMYVDVVPPDTTTFTVTGLQPQTTYNFSVNALNSIGESGYADDGAVLTITTEGQSGVTPQINHVRTDVNCTFMKIVFFLRPLSFFIVKKDIEEDRSDDDTQGEFFPLNF